MQVCYICLLRLDCTHCQFFTACDNVLDELNKQSNNLPIPVHWVFVIQHNNAPNHCSFLNSTYRFLTNREDFPFVARRDAVVLHANTAISKRPSRGGEGAFSACIFSPYTQFVCNVCRPTVCMQ